ncbi:unnamed protein product, partial [Strongylus vulgaris]
AGGGGGGGGGGGEGQGTQVQGVQAGPAGRDGAAAAHCAQAAQAEHSIHGLATGGGGQHNGPAGGNKLGIDGRTKMSYDLDGVHMIAYTAYPKICPSFNRE